MEKTLERDVMEEAVESTMNAENNEEVEFEMNQDSQGNVEAEVEVTKERKINMDHAIGASIGASLAGVAGSVAWWYERRARLKVLKTLEKASILAYGIIKDDRKVEFDGEEYDIANEQINNPVEFTKYISKTMEEMKLGKKEKKRWLEVVGHTLNTQRLAGIISEDEVEDANHKEIVDEE